MAEGLDTKTAVVKLELKRVQLEEFVQSDVRLRSCGLLKGLLDADVKVLLQQGKLRRFLPKAPIFEQAEAGDSLFWVLKGEAWVAQRANAQLVDLGPVQRGEVFGESEISEAPAERHYSVRATGEVDVAEFDREAILDVAKRSPELLGYLRDVKARRLSTQGDMLAFLNRW